MDAREAVGDEIESGVRILRNIDAKVKGSLKEVLVDFVFCLLEAKDHHAIGIIVVPFGGRTVEVLHIGQRPLFGDRHLGRQGQGSPPS